ncbi:hypothetical protein DPMN_135510 [Dreissena polymorpha]|uniref:Uncharacterized protein n=1 Tax=Dreissena polymorpha TaxID=45954 RepID=A0A9D4G206_DREPO|nr:hypothetical protein DPMN_135510 [Dreissena polymorpha]
MLPGFVNHVAQLSGSRYLVPIEPGCIILQDIGSCKEQGFEFSSPDLLWFWIGRCPKIVWMSNRCRLYLYELCIRSC